MNQKFLWTARCFEGNKVIESKYFASKLERDLFVASHPNWKKRGKICKENLNNHLVK